ncbi:uncharacterized protein LOC111692311 isoform X2 [Anoplophora glabripennis]|nr:uncharacterized protein LOC111692311 isoform X2 [Anoplophora glabripennis]
MKNSIRRIVHSFFFKNEIPTLDKILTEIKSRQDLPQMSRSSLYKFMKQINFKYLKRSRKSVLIERDDIVRWRLDYLISIKKFRSEGRPIYYLDETWLNEGHTKERDVRELLIEALNNVTNMNWKKCVEHVIKEEEKMGTLDGIMDDLIEPLIISINNSESDMDTDSSNNSEN